MNSTHCVEVVKIREVLKHPNADTLGIVKVGGYQVIIKLNEFKLGDLAAYVQPDSIVPENETFSWLWTTKEIKEKYGEFPKGQVPLRYRRITVRKFRGEWSEGLLIKLPLNTSVVKTVVKEGDDLAKILEITHYVPPEPEILQSDNKYGPGSRQNKIWPRSLKGWIYFLWQLIRRDPIRGLNEKAPSHYRPIYDVEAYKNHLNIFEPKELVVITEKIHGCNARYSFVANLFGYHMYAGSRQLWKREGNNIWRKCLAQNPWIFKWCKAHPDYTLYGEIVPTQGKYDYGCKPGEYKLFVFDILTPDGKWMEWQQITKECLDKLNWVPILRYGEFSETLVNNLVNGPSKINGANNIREGIVIKSAVEREVRNLGRAQLKIISNEFLEKE